MSSSAPPRRFKPEPIETSVKSSKDSSREQADTSKSRRRFAPEPIETTTKTHRKVVPELVKTIKKNRKFIPEPIETTAKSSRASDASEPPSNARKRFNPEPIETTTSSNRKQEENAPRIIEPPSSTSTKDEKKPPRRFAPQLIETAKRSRKAGDTTPAVLPSDKTEATPGDSTQSPRKTRIQSVPAPPDNTPIADVSQNPLFLEIKRAASPLAIRRPSSRASTRSHHSFRVPELDPIASSESEGSSPPSPSTSPSATSDHSYMYKEATRMRESVDDRFSGYLLELAARAAEKQLREQAMAAFPNDDHHEPVDHFIDRDSDESEVSVDETKRRRESSFTEVNWDLVAMQQHREKLEQQQETERKKKERREAQMNNPQGNPASLFNAANRDIVGGWQKDRALDRMRKGARPPMLGGDIKFPRCPSPEPARFDPTQGSNTVRSAMCYLTEQNQAAERGEGLWCGKNRPSNRPSLWSNTSSRPPSSAGLWGGCCVNSGLTPPRGPTGILTPKVEIENPLDTPNSTPARHQLPPTPPPSNPDIASIDEKLATELTIEEEFGDDFVTQIYNYLSLGYPSIARDFDEELSKISRIPVCELRQDDHLLTSRGYIRLGEDGDLRDAEITEESCMRWRALRLYVYEWARQQPRMVACDNSGGIGAAARKGSWAV
ncbi:hypothetical protein K469DRAFT_569357 [Zopfia rhizophila CBS 207.26]|uniref:Uncharacterized protein n=1 Tax=Zopfia rhizophila CBS 207.26 TaxID=1314779 RepID=A0A6A6E9L6_9PEZI|nr:hypothetical protein K469DRAFT_569357 [Zopfia rhizophila CBS 207.26]